MAKFDNDITFVLNKCVYHRNRFLELLNTTENQIKKEFKHIAVTAMIREKIEFDGKSEYLAELNFEKALIEPCIYEFDSFMLECKRLVEYVIRLIAKIYGHDAFKKGKGLEAFFNNTMAPNKREFVVFLEKERPQLLAFWMNEWDSWIRDLNSYRTKSVHKFIPNKVLVSGKVFWNSVSEKHNPREVSLDELKLKEVDTGIKVLVENIASRLVPFITNTHKFMHQFERV